jgi:hypothetical protein
MSFRPSPRAFHPYVTAQLTGELAGGRRLVPHTHPSALVLTSVLGVMRGGTCSLCLASTGSGVLLSCSTAGQRPPLKVDQRTGWRVDSRTDAAVESSYRQRREGREQSSRPRADRGRLSFPHRGSAHSQSRTVHRLTTACSFVLADATSSPALSVFVAWITI